MPERVNLLYDVQPVALTLCKEGANRKRIFLKKEHVAVEDLIELPAHDEHRMIRKADGGDWSYFYCVVAEPGAREDPGCGDGAGSGIEDMWRDEEEIRKAAHYFAESPKLVNGLHDTIEPFGSVVENAIAQTDFAVLDPEGNEQTIRKGSWYVGIRPSEEGRVKIDNGEFTGLSLEGGGYREEVELQKAKDEKRSLLRKLADVMGVEQEDIRKSPEQPTFKTLVAERNLELTLEDGFGVLREVIYQALSPSFEGDRAEVIKASLQQFADHIGETVDAVPSQNHQALAKELGTVEQTNEEDEMDATDKQRIEKIDGLENEVQELRKEASATSNAINKLSGLVETLVERVAPAKKEGEDEGEAAPSAADLKKSIDKLADQVGGKLDELEGGVSRLAESGSSQDDDDEAADRIRKAREQNPLAGILD